MSSFSKKRVHEPPVCLDRLPLLPLTDQRSAARAVIPSAAGLLFRRSAAANSRYRRSARCCRLSETIGRPPHRWCRPRACPTRSSGTAPAAARHPESAASSAPDAPRRTDHLHPRVHVPVPRALFELVVTRSSGLDSSLASRDLEETRSFDPPRRRRLLCHLGHTLEAVAHELHLVLLRGHVVRGASERLLVSCALLYLDSFSAERVRPSHLLGSFCRSASSAVFLLVSLTLCQYGSIALITCGTGTSPRRYRLPSAALEAAAFDFGQPICTSRRKSL